MNIIMPIDTPPPSPGDPTTQPPDPGGIKFDPPGNIETTFELDEEGTGYYIHEKVGDIDIHPPSHITMDQYLQWRRENGVQEYWRDRALSQSDFVDGGALAPKFAVNSEAFRDIFGGGSVEIRPNGTALIDLGAEFNRSQNPSLPIRQQRNGNMRFDQQIQLNVVGKIGEKLRLNANWDTQATFDFENQLKLEFTGTEDEIIQKIEAGNVSLPLNGSLISGGQNLFGIKVAMKFGPVMITSIASQQKGKTQNVTATGGAQVTEFRKKGNEYDENRHFFLSHYFRSRYQHALKGRPNINSPITITRVEAYITNNNSASTTNNRNAVGFIDLGESETPPSGSFQDQKGVVFNDQWNQTSSYPANGANDLFSQLKAQPNAAAYEAKTSVVDALTSNLSLENGVDFTLIENMRRLNENEFSFHSQLGYVSLNTPLQPNQVLFVAFEYMQGGQVYQVGEFTLDKPSNNLNSNVLFLKMLKPGQVRPVYDGKPYPTWDLMMKNIYSIGGFGITRDNFRMDIMLDSRTQAGDIPVLPSGPQKNVPLVRVFGMDTLQNNSQQGPDGIFDFMEGITIIPDRGLIIFPVLEPFGDWLRAQLENDPEEVDKYVFDTLYSATRQDAIQYANDKDRFYVTGSYQGRSSTEIPLNSINVAQGSVKVTANGITLQEGIDYRVDYNIGKVIVLNEGILTSGQELNVTFETNTLFGIDTKTLVGSRMDVLLSKDVQLGATILHLNERPLTNKINIGDEPISNVIWGLDGVMRKDSRFLTRMVDKLPLIQTSEVSTVTAQGEFAQLLPGHPKAIQVNGESGIAYLDDFESAKTTFDLMGFNAWSLASFPGDNGNNAMYVPQGGWNPALNSGFSRAKFAWYSIDQSFYFGTIDENFPQDDLNNHYSRQVSPNEAFPNQTNIVGNNQQRTFDLHFIPNQRGPYNYETDPAVLNADGTFKNPEDNWGGIQRRTSGNTDFEAANFEFIEFWMLDPFIYNQNNGGEFYLNLGQISEDVLKDNVRNFENGLPADPNDTLSVDTSAWARYPLTTPPITSFNNEPESRQFQDVGLDGMWDDLEREFFSPFLQELENGFGQGSGVYAQMQADPSGDNYRYFRGPDLDGVGILDRYLPRNGHDGNTPIGAVQDGFSTQGSPTPDTEDLNLNGTLNTNEEYWEYKMNFQPSEMRVGQNYIVDIIPADVPLPNGNTESVNWYQFRIPLTSGKAINSIQNFKAIEFVRMYMKGWSEEAILRFARFQLVSTSWRTVRDYLGDQGDSLITDPQPGTTFEIGTVNVEENTNRQPFPYVLPPQIVRQNQVASPQPGLLQNEQSIVLKACGLQDGDARGAFKLVTYDMRSYKRLKMWVHAENVIGSNQDFDDGELKAFMRIGSDTRENYYEYEIPINPSEPGARDSLGIWANNFDIELANLGVVKSIRDAQGWPVINRFEYEDTDLLPPGHRVYVVGTPKISDVKGIMIGIRNEKDGRGPICAEVWMNELRLVDFDEESGWAANARVSVKLADFATINASGSIRTPGFGALEQKIYNRSRETVRQFDVAGNFNLGKFFPKDWGIQLPLYVTYGERVVDPDFNPLESDVRMTNYLNTLEAGARDSVLYSLQDRRINKSISMNNIRKVRTRKPTSTRGKNEAPKTKPWDIENFALSLSYNETFASNHLTERNLTTNHRAQISYNYNFNSKPWEPFKKAKKKNFITAFNFNPLPKTFSVSVLGDRRYEENQIRTSSNGIPIQPTYLKNFSITRTYNLRWDFTKSLSLNYTATNTGRVNEALVGPTDETNNDTLWNNFLSFGRQEGYNGVDSLGRDKRVNFGRNIRFNQNVGLNYILPFDKFSLTNWINGTVSYQGGYNWQAAPDNNLTLGNQINNSQNIQANGRLNMDNLYNKVRFLRNIMAEGKAKAPPAKPGGRPGPKPGEEETEKQKKKREKREKKLAEKEEKKKGNKKEGEEGEDEEEEDPYAFIRAVGKGFARILLSVKNVDMTYGRNMNTAIAGYMPSTDNFGLDYNYQYEDPNGNLQNGVGMAPGIPFILGWQPEVWSPNDVGNAYLLNEFASNGWISNDANLATPFSQSWSEQLTARTSVTLFKDFKVDLNITKNNSRNYSELFRFDEGNDRFLHENQLMTGQYSISYIFLGTAFESFDAEGSAFQQLQDNDRRIISQRLYAENPEYQDFLDGAGIQNHPDSILTSDLYYQGYYRNSQEVLVPAFRAAYGAGKSEKAALSAFPAIPLPNWTINYNGLGRIPALKELFKSVTLRHSYRGSYSVGGFTSNVRFEGDPNSGFTDSFFGASLDAITSDSIYNIRSQNVIPQVAFTESFAPLAGVNVNFKNGISASVDLKMSRNISLSIGNTQITESRTKDFSFSLSYRKDKLNKIIQLFGRTLDLKNSLNSRLEVSLRDSKTRNQKLDFEGNADFTSGNFMLIIKPSIDYVVNSKLNIRFYIEHTRNKPAISTSFPSSFSAVGFQVRFTLAN